MRLAITRKVLTRLEQIDAHLACKERNLGASTAQNTLALEDILVHVQRHLLGLPVHVKDHGPRGIPDDRQPGQTRRIPSPKSA